MPSTTGASDLIILLSQGKVDVRLWMTEGSEAPSGISSFQVQSIFLADQVAGAMDEALLQNPSLLDDFESVDILLVDQPGVIIPSAYADDESLTTIAGRYLRSRTGDIISSDIAAGDVQLAYSLPIGTLNTLREYYSNAGPLHLTSILWSYLFRHDRFSAPSVTSRLFFLMMDDSMVILGEKEGKLSFARNFRIYGPGDLLYFALACSRMLHADEHWHVALSGEKVRFEMPYTSFFSFHHHLELPGLQHLIAHHRSCGS